MADVKVEAERLSDTVVAINVTDGGRVVLGINLMPSPLACTAGIAGCAFIWSRQPDAEQRCREWLRAVGEACIEASKVEVPRG